jgi:enoyl-CoA hydratase
LTLNRPKAMNALSHALRRELVQAINALAADPDVRVLVLTGAGPAFCAGLDLKELGAGASGNVLELENLELNPVAALARFPGPVIGAINGVAITGGFELALACDVLIASDKARFADTHARVGVIPFWGLSQKLSRIMGAGRAKELSFTGDFLDAQRAEHWGVVGRVVAHEQLLAQAIAMAESMLSTVPETLLAYKRLIDDGLALPYGEALALEQHRALAAMDSTDPAALEQRRHAVRARGQAQVSS